jgi:hypothetical protein
LLLHQRPEGAFGFFGPEQHAVAHLAPEGATAQSVLNLSVTIDCMWTLLEAASQPYCRLFGKLSIINKPARS